jgi:hypothetical protein
MLEMKKVLIMVIGLSMMATAANAFGPAAYMGIYADEAREVMEFMGVGGFSVKTWINPSDNGVSVMEYMIGIEGTPTLFTQLLTKNPDMGFSSGDLFQGTGIQISCPCQPDWFWTSQLDLYFMGGGPAYIVVLPHGDFGTLQVGGCDELKTLEPLNPINKFGLGALGIVPNETSTWGAIKSLINE